VSISVKDGEEIAKAEQKELVVDLNILILWDVPKATQNFIRFTNVLQQTGQEWGLKSPL